MKLFVGFVICAVAVCLAQAVCNTCSTSNGIACVANDQFRVCVNGVPSSPTIQCPNGTLCSETGEVCSSSATTACSDCGICNGTGAFACTGYNTFTLCNGTTTPGNGTYVCPASTVCNVNTENICVDPTTSGLEGSCPSVGNSTTTPNPATSPQAYCSNVAKEGRYDIPTDTTCKTYINCSLNGGRWIGNVYTCPGTTTFNATNGFCGTTIPSRCG